MIDYYSDRNVLITGGLGFVGSNLAIQLQSLGANVSIVDSLSPEYGASIKNIESIHRDVKLNISDIRDRQVLRHLVQGQDVIFSLAGQTSHSASMTKPLVDLDMNCRSQLTLLECCRHFNPKARLVFTGTRQIYGRPKQLPVPEDHPICPTDVNGINKWAAERYFVLYAEVYGMSTICLRLTNTFGPRMDIHNPRKGFIGVFIGQALRGEKLRIFGSGEQRRDFNYVSDVVDALLRAGRHRELSGQCFNLGHQEHYSLQQFVQFLSEFCAVKSETIPFPENARAIDIGDYYADFSAYRDATQWQPIVGLREGLERTIQFYQLGSTAVA